MASFSWPMAPHWEAPQGSPPHPTGSACSLLCLGSGPRFDSGAGREAGGLELLYLCGLPSGGWGGRRAGAWRQPRGWQQGLQSDLEAQLVGAGGGGSGMHNLLPSLPSDMGKTQSAFLCPQPVLNRIGGWGWGPASGGGHPPAQPQWGPVTSCCPLL